MQYRTAPGVASGIDPPGADNRCADACQDVECGRCTGLGRDDGVGLCPVCQERVPRAGGCGAGLWLVAAVAGEGETDAPLEHLIRCPACRAFFDVLAALVWCASQEVATQQQAPHAARLPGGAA